MRDGKSVVLPSYEEVSTDKQAFATMSRLFQFETNAHNGRSILQVHGKQAVFFNPPALPLAESEMDEELAAPVTRTGAEVLVALLQAFESRLARPFAEVREADVARFCEEVVREGSDAVAIVCTNMRGAGAAERLERKLGAGIFDSIAVTLWACLVAAGVDASVIRSWGGLFANPHLLPSTSASTPLRRYP